MEHSHETHAHFARTFNMETWGLLQQAERSAEDEERMIAAAHASLRHWLVAGGPVEQQRGLWLVSHVYAELGMGEPAARYARRCLEVTERSPEEMADFDNAYAFEAVARAAAVCGDSETARAYRARAAESGERIANDEDREIFTGDLAGGVLGEMK